MTKICFDQCVIFVPDLDLTIQQFSELGFTVNRGLNINIHAKHRLCIVCFDNNIILSQKDSEAPLLKDLKEGDLF